MKNRVSVYIQTYGMIAMCLLVLLGYAFVRKFTPEANFDNHRIIQSISLLLANFFILLCAINVIRLREWPRPYMQSVTGTKAIITGIILLLVSVIIAINVIAILIKII